MNVGHGERCCVSYGDLFFPLAWGLEKQLPQLSLFVCHSCLLWCCTMERTLLLELQSLEKICSFRFEWNPGEGSGSQLP